MEAVDVRTRIQLKNILYATDFSPTANAAAPYVAELTNHYGAKLYALHVRAPAVNPMAPPASWKSLEEAAEIEAARARAQATTVRILPRKGIRQATKEAAA